MKPTTTEYPAHPGKALLRNTALLACALGLGTWLVLSALVPQKLPEDFPKLPHLQSQNAELRELINTADAEARAHPNSAKSIGRLGMIYHSNQFYEQAECAYKIASRLGPDDYRWTYCRALVKEENGQEKELFDLLNKTVQQRPDFIPATLKLADMYFKQDKLDEAERYCDISIRAAGKSSSLQAIFGLGRIAARRRDWQKVIEYLAPLSQEYPLIRPPHQVLADAYEALGQAEKAAEEHRNLLQPNLIIVPPVKDPVADELLDLCCLSTRLLKEAGFTSRFGTLDQVLRLARRAVEVEPDDADARHFLSRTLLKSQGNNPKAVSEALVHLNEGLHLRPDDLNPLLLVADIFYSQNKIDAAIEQLRAMLARNANSAEGHYKLGVVMEHKGKIKEAVAHYRLALRENPHYAEPYHRLGLVLVGERKLDQAIRHLQKAVLLKPTFDLAYYNLGLALEKKGKLDQAIEHFKKAVLLKPTFALAYFNLGLALEKQGKTNEAIAQYSEVLRLEPFDATAHMKLGLVLAQLGKLDEAIRHFRETVQIMPGDAEAHYALGCILASQGKVQEAAEELRQTLKLQPNYVEARKQLQELERKKS